MITFNENLFLDYIFENFHLCGIAIYCWRLDHHHQAIQQQLILHSILVNCSFSIDALYREKETQKFAFALPPKRINQKNLAKFTFILQTNNRVKNLILLLASL